MDKAALALAGVTATSLVAFVVATLAGAERVAEAAAWAVLPATVVMGALVGAAVAGYGLSGAIWLVVIARRAWRRCTRG